MIWILAVFLSAFLATALFGQDGFGDLEIDVRKRVESFLQFEKQGEYPGFTFNIAIEAEEGGIPSETTIRGAFIKIGDKTRFQIVSREFKNGEYTPGFAAFLDQGGRIVTSKSRLLTDIRDRDRTLEKEKVEIESIFPYRPFTIVLSHARFFTLPAKSPILARIDERGVPFGARHTKTGTEAAWISPRTGLILSFLFDDRFGGMPSRYEQWGADSKTLIDRTESEWKEYKYVNPDNQSQSLWLPISVSSNRFDEDSFSATASFSWIHKSMIQERVFSKADLELSLLYQGEFVSLIEEHFPEQE